MFQSLTPKRLASKGQVDRAEEKAPAALLLAESRVVRPDAARVGKSLCFKNRKSTLPSGFLTIPGASHP